MTSPPLTVSPLAVGAGFWILRNRALFRITGAERAAFLNGLVTNDVKKLSPGAGCYAAWLTPKGKMLADLVVLALPGWLELDAEPSLRPRLAELLGKYGPFSPVEIRDETGTEEVFHLAGPESPRILGLFGLADLPAMPYQHMAVDLGEARATLVCLDRGIEPGFDLRVPAADAGAVRKKLLSAGCAELPEASLEAVRIHAGIPRWGFDLDESVLPDEAGLNRTAVSYSKGCYIGQETVARLKTYGHVNRHLVQFLLPATCAPLPGAAITRAGEPVGKVTSAALSLDGSLRAALGYVKREAAAEGTEVEVVAEPAPVSTQVRTLPRPRPAP
ncbi:MAG: hypothetical protein L6R30_18270 [Thermoanaerobaculia bacterium]|nr:hypothetical protein [Thermoanaerobaculia bacterium]